MKAAELRELSPGELEERLTELHAEWRDLRFREAVGQLTATARTRQIRKDIARILTIKGEAARQQPVAGDAVPAATAVATNRPRRIRLRTAR